MTSGQANRVARGARFPDVSLWESHSLYRAIKTSMLAAIPRPADQGLHAQAVEGRPVATHAVCLYCKYLHCIKGPEAMLPRKRDRDISSSAKVPPPNVSVFGSVPETSPVTAAVNRLFVQNARPREPHHWHPPTSTRGVRPWQQCSYFRPHDAALQCGFSFASLYSKLGLGTKSPCGRLNQHARAVTIPPPVDPYRAWFDKIMVGPSP